MFRTKPRLKYCGLTFIMSNPSRFDTTSLLSGPGGHLLNDHCLRPNYNVMQCDVRLVQDTSPFLPDTKCVVLLGEKAMHQFIPQTASSTLKEMRGSPFQIGGLVFIASFLPQDACDVKDCEARLNPLSEHYSPDDDEADSDEEGNAEEGDTKKLGKTSRSNYAFWLRMDVRKAIKVVKNNGKIPWTPEEMESPNYRIYPPSDEVCRLLRSAKGELLFFDIETDYEEQNLQCFSFKIGRDSTVYSVPILDYNYNPAYSSYYRIIQSLAIAINNNIVVAHNGAGFDFLVLAYKYKIPVRQVFDTMLALHRCFPDVEKSLGHGTSLFTNQVFHKSEDSEGYRTKEQMMQRLKYCGKDVWTMSLLYYEMMRYAETIPGLSQSIQRAQDAIVPYLTTTLQGLRCDTDLILKKANESDRLMMQYNRMINLLIGETGLRMIRQNIKGKAKMFAGSNTQCCIYFHDLLGYKVVARSPKTGKPSLGKKAMYKLSLLYPDNPVIQLVLAYRKVQKEFGTYKFVPFWDDENKQGTKTILEYAHERAETNQLVINGIS